MLREAAPADCRPRAAVPPRAECPPRKAWSSRWSARRSLELFELAETAKGERLYWSAAACTRGAGPSPLQIQRQPLRRIFEMNFGRDSGASRIARHDRIKNGLVLALYGLG